MSKNDIIRLYINGLIVFFLFPLGTTDFAYAQESIESTNLDTVTEISNDTQAQSEVKEFFSDIVKNKHSVLYQNTHNFFNAGFIEGYEDNMFRPYREVTRAEFIKVALMTLKYQAEGGGCYVDVKDEWYAPHICKAKELGLVHGYEDGNFRPNQSIKFVEAAKIAAKAFELELEMAEEIDKEWFYAYVMALEKTNAIPIGIQGFAYALTREQMVEIIYRLFYKEVDRDSLVYSDLEGKTDYLAYISIEQALNLKEKYDHRNPVFDLNNWIHDYEYYQDHRFEVREKNLEKVEQFLNKAGFSEIISSLKENVKGGYSITNGYIDEQSCKVIYELYNERYGDEEELMNRCDLAFKVYEIDNQYIFLRIYVDGRGEPSLLNILYDLETGDINFIDARKNNTNVYFYEGVLYFNDVKGQLYLTYDIKSNASKKYTGISNSSYEWFLKYTEEGIIVESIDGTKKVNLGMVPKNLKADESNFYFFQTNKNATQFSLPIYTQSEVDKIINGYKLYGIGPATILYGEMKDGGLNDALTYKIKIGYPYSSEVSHMGDSILMDDNLIITQQSYPYFFEFTIFDTELGEFLYRDNAIFSRYTKPN